MASDEDLLAAWRAGDRAAGNDLVSRHFDSLFRFFDAKLAGEAEDLVQRTLLDCLESRAELRDGFRAYLFGVARHRLIDHLRARHRCPQPIDLDVISVADLGTSPSQLFARDSERRRLHQAMRSIAIDQQIALELAYWEGLSGAEIASVLGVDPNTVRSRLSRARQELRDRLADSGAAGVEIDTTLDQLQAGAA